MNSKVIGGILLILGTSIGGGILALPIATAGGGYWHSALLIFLCWVIMTFSALLLLEVNLWLPPHKNMISMARMTLGKPGALLAWITYLLLLYALLAAYISGGTSILQELLSALSINTPAWLNAILFCGSFGYVVYRGIKPVDYVNRSLMSLKLIGLFTLIAVTLPYLDFAKLLGGSWLTLHNTVTIIITAFGFAIIVPSLRNYYEGDVIKLRYTILVGSLIPLVCYLIWEFAIIGTLPRTGENGLLHILKEGQPTVDLPIALSYYLKNSFITVLAHFFTSICVLTSFLGVSLGLSDFLADGLDIPKVGKGKIIISAATFLPPLLLIWINPSIFIKALNYAGIFCVILLVLLPGAMVWSGRYVKKIATGYQVIGGRFSLCIIIGVALAIIGLDLSLKF